GDQVFRVRDRSGLRLFEIPLEVGDAPSAARPRAAALADLAGAAGLMNADEIQNLPLRDVKAVADRVVEFHGAEESKRSKEGYGMQRFYASSMIPVAPTNTNARFNTSRGPYDAFS